MVGQPSRAPLKSPLQGMVGDGKSEHRLFPSQEQKLLTALSPTLPAPAAPLLLVWDVQ